MIGRGMPKPERVTVRKFVPLSEIQGMELPADELPESYSQDVLAREDMQQGIQDEDAGRSQEMAMTEGSHASQQQLIEQILQAVAEQKAWSQQMLDREQAQQANIPTLKSLMGAFPSAPPVQQPAADPSFSQAFADARRQGLKVFKWKNPRTGKVGEYNTDLKWDAKRNK